jgi:hypothetical protein
MITGIVKSFGKAVSTFKNLKEIRNVPTDAIDSILKSISGIVWYYRTVKFGKHIEAKSILTEYVVDKFTIMAMNIQDKLGTIKSIDHNAIISIVLACRYIINYYRKTKFSLRRKKILNMNDSIKLFTKNIDYLKGITFTTETYNSIKLAVKSMKHILKFLKRNSLNKILRKRANKNISLLSRMSSVMSRLSSINSLKISSIGTALTDALSGVNTIDMDQVVAVTNMFNAFNRINKSENIINKFTESVKEFTETCKNLMDAMSQNTDAINNIDNSNISNVSTYDNSNEKSNGFIENNSNGGGDNGKSGGIRIANVDEIAKVFAEKINGALSIDVPDTQVQLLINGSGGNEWTITRY